MDIMNVSTPFGRRPMTLGMLASQKIAASAEPNHCVDKWKLFRMICDAKPLIGVNDRALAVLNALLSFYPQPVLDAAEKLVVFPSNAQLALRAHGMAETTLRRHLAALVDAGLITRRDSPNGKRYARKDRAGDIREAFGFSLAPLVARSQEIATLANTIIAERLAVQEAREQISLCRRDVGKLIETALNEGLPGDWDGMEASFRQIVTSLPRKATAAILAPVLEKLESLRTEIVIHLENHAKSQKPGGNDNQNDRHIQNSNTQSISEFERCETDLEPKNVGPASPASKPKIFPLSLVLKACPEITAYGPGGTISNWHDFKTAAIVVHSMLGVTPSAYRTACDTLGQDGAAIAVACILERSDHITSAGGYLRDLTRRAEKNAFSLGPMLMALLRGGGDPAAKRARN